MQPIITLQKNPDQTNPPPLPPRGTGATDSSTPTGIFGVLSQMFESFFPKQPSFLILPDDIIHHTFTSMPNKDLLAVTGTCMRLYDMRALFEVKGRFPRVKIPQPLFGIPLDRKGTELLKTANLPPLDALYTTPYTQYLEDKFYFHFKVRCMELNVYSNNCASFIYAKVSIENLNKKCISLNIITYDMGIKLKSIESNFYCKIFDDVLATYASQLKGITPRSFKAKVAELKGLLPNMAKSDIEAALRKAIRAHPNIAEIDALAEGYLDPTSPTFAELKQALKAKLELCKVNTQVKINELCGSSFNGTIHTAFCTMTLAEAESNAALAAAPQHAFGTLRSFSSTLDTCFLLDEAFIAARAQHNQLCAELNSLAVWTGVNITGGAISKFRKNLII